MRFKVHVTAIAENGETIDLGIASVNAADAEDACSKALEEREDPRLRSASCRMRAEVLEEYEGDEG